MNEQVFACKLFSYPSTMQRLLTYMSSIEGNTIDTSSDQNYKNKWKVCNTKSTSTIKNSVRMFNVSGL
jgi:hypothetical protein